MPPQTIADKKYSRGGKGGRGENRELRKTSLFTVSPYIRLLCSSQPRLLTIASLSDDKDD